MPEPEYPEALLKQRKRLSRKAVIQCVVDVHGKPQQTIVSCAPRGKKRPPHLEAAL